MSDPGKPFMPLEDVIGIVKERDDQIARLAAEVENLRTANADLVDGVPCYCPTCGACGEEECCPVDQCKMVPCMYGENYFSTYRELEDENKRLQAVVEAAREALHLDASLLDRMIAIRRALDGEP